MVKSSPRYTFLTSECSIISSLVPDVKTDLSSYVVEEAMDGIFHYLALEEAKIRNDPAARTTDLLKKVFSN